MNGTPREVRQNFRQAVLRRAGIFVPTVVFFELAFGVHKSARREWNAKRLQEFLEAPIQLVPFEQQDASAAAEIRAELQAAGKPMGAYDYLIAGQARARNLTLITSNVREFSRVRGLAWADWARP